MIRAAYRHWLTLPVGDRPAELATREKFSKHFKCTLAQMLAWEAQVDFMEQVRADNTHMITKKPSVIESLRERGSNLSDKEQLVYAAAFLIAIGDTEIGERLSKLAAQ